MLLKAILMIVLFVGLSACSIIASCELMRDEANEKNVRRALAGVVIISSLLGVIITTL